MHASKVSILGTEISRMGLSAAIAECAQRAQEGRGGYFCFVNVHSLTDSCSNPHLRESFQGAAHAFADGVPLIWVSHWKRQPVESRVCGPDFMAHYLSSHAEYPHGFIGGKEGQALSLEQRFGIRSISYVTPHRPFSAENARHDWEEFLKRCPERRPPPVVWVCLGAPKQELWMKEIAALAPGVLFFGVGAAFDFLTGAKSRAPRWMQKSGMEWLHRLLQEPGRLAKRYLFSNALFAWLLLRECLSRRSA